MLACVVGPYALPYNSLHIDLRARFAPPLSGQHYFGTDPLGRDLAARLLMAGRVSLLVGFSAMLLSTLIGTLVGVTAGYRGGWIGAALMRTVDGFLSFPLDLPRAGAGRDASAQRGDDHRHHRRHELDGGCQDRRGRGALAARA